MEIILIFQYTHTEPGDSTVKTTYLLVGRNSVSRDDSPGSNTQTVNDGNWFHQLVSSDPSSLSIGPRFDATTI